MLIKLKAKLKGLAKNKKGSELVEKIMMIAVSVAVGAVVIGVIWTIVDKYANDQKLTDPVNGGTDTTGGTSHTGA